MAKTQTRTLAKLFGVFHNITYYADELSVFQDRGIKKFWHGYLAYRSAPMGQLEAPAVTAAFYNFAPSLVDAAIPAVWDHVTPAEAILLRQEVIETVLTNAFASHDIDDSAIDIAATVLPVLVDLPAAGRPLFASYAKLPTPEQPLMQLWHTATLWREYRGDGHNIALAAADIDGIECHVLLAGKGVADKEVIIKIRGWTAAEWDAAHDRLLTRGLVTPTGKLTAAGAELRQAIEVHTDRLAARPLDRLGPKTADRVIAQLTPIVDVMISSGVVPGRWPPPKPLRP